MTYNATIQAVLSDEEYAEFLAIARKKISVSAKVDELTLTEKTLDGQLHDLFEKAGVDSIDVPESNASIRLEGVEKKNLDEELLKSKYPEVYKTALATKQAKVSLALTDVPKDMSVIREPDTPEGEPTIVVVHPRNECTKVDKTKGKLVIRPFKQGASE